MAKFRYFADIDGRSFDLSHIEHVGTVKGRRRQGLPARRRPADLQAQRQGVCHPRDRDEEQPEQAQVRCSLHKRQGFSLRVRVRRQEPRCQQRLYVRGGVMDESAIAQVRLYIERALGGLNTLHLGPLDYNVFTTTDYLRTAANMLDDLHQREAKRLLTQIGDPG